MRKVVFIVLAGIHGFAIIVTPKFLEAVIASTIYVPLLFAKYLGVSLFEHSSSHGWSTPTFFGYCFLLVFWILIWAGVSMAICKFMKKPK